MSMPIPPDVKQCVAFIYVKAAPDRALPNGTGFFFTVPDPSDAKRSFVYLVTAAHVLKQGPDATGAFYPEVLVRLNRNGSGTDLLSLPLVPDGPRRNVFLHPDPSVDLAAIPFAPDQAAYLYKAADLSLVPTDEETRSIQLSEGADVFFAGLFTPFVSESANIPIVRFGRVALSTSEPIPWGGFKRHLLLVECASYGGNSGAPVFFYLGSERNPGQLVAGAPELKLAGVMMGAYQDIRPVQTVGTSAVPVSTANMGIAAVVPAAKVRELVNCPALVQQRALVAAARVVPGT